MAYAALLEKARQRRLDALSSLGTRRTKGHDDTAISIFDGVFDDDVRFRRAMSANVLPFRTQRLASNETIAAVEAEKIAA